MKCILWPAICCLILVSGAQVGAQGTYTRPSTGPSTSAPLNPYLNLVRGGNPAVNYYGLVRPQVDAQRSLQQLQQQQPGTSTPASYGMSPDGAPNSGHPVQFMNFSHYFSNSQGLGLNGRTSGPASLRR
jgi:hypothetical protein